MGDIKIEYTVKRSSNWSEGCIRAVAAGCYGQTVHPEFSEACIKWVAENPAYVPLRGRFMSGTMHKLRGLRITGLSESVSYESHVAQKACTGVEAELYHELKSGVYDEELGITALVAEIKEVNKL